MKRTLLALVAGAVLLIGAGAPDAIADVKRSTRIEREMEGDCQFEWLNRDVRWSDYEERITTDCLFDKWPLRYGRGVFDCIIAHESGWDRNAYNAAGPYVGLGQHGLRYWPGRVSFYEPDAWDLKRNWRNSRTMLTITLRMMRSAGIFGPWPGTSRTCT